MIMGGLKLKHYLSYIANMKTINVQKRLLLFVKLSIEQSLKQILMQVFMMKHRQSLAYILLDSFYIMDMIAYTNISNTENQAGPNSNKARHITVIEISTYMTHVTHSRICEICMKYQSYKRVNAYETVSILFLLLQKMKILHFIYWSAALTF